MMKFCKVFALTDNMFDANDRIKLSAIFDLFQTVAGEHIKELGYATQSLLKQDLTWVLLRFRLDFLGEIKRYQSVKVITWPHTTRRVEFFREYELRDERTDELLVTGGALWAIVDLKTKRIANGDIIHYPTEALPSIHYTRLGKIEYLDETLKVTGKYHVTEDDLDLNGHMNNTKYVKFIFGNFAWVEINYFHETKLNDCLLIKENSQYLAGFVEDICHFVVHYLKKE